MHQKLEKHFSKHMPDFGVHDHGWNKRKQTRLGLCCIFGIAHHGILHTTEVHEVILILLPAVGWVAAATLVVMFPKDSWNVARKLCLMLGCTKI